MSEASQRVVAAVAAAERFDAVRESRLSESETSSVEGRDVEARRKRGPKKGLFKRDGIQAAIQASLQGVKSGVDKDEDDHHVTPILVSSSDEFSLSQDMCLSCGSFGAGEEGRLIACSQCGQCYHPYCVNRKPTKVILQKGWRCLECTLCEGCGKNDDEARLLLCDDCDVSYHTYCLDPPLDHVPKGTWKCKWCVFCVDCGTTSPGIYCDWQNNYSQCGPCAAMTICPICKRHYREEDLIILCMQCDRWVHAGCDGMRTEEEVEKVSEIGYNCLVCRPRTGMTEHPLRVALRKEEEGRRQEMEERAKIAAAQVAAERAEKERELAKSRPPMQYFLDGVCLSETGINRIRSLQMNLQSSGTKKGRRGTRAGMGGNRGGMLGGGMLTGGMNKNHPQMAKLLHLGGAEVPGEDSDEERDAELDEKMDEDGVLAGVDGSLGPDGKKKRLRKPMRLGIGGFMVRGNRGRGGFLTGRGRPPIGRGGHPADEDTTGGGADGDVDAAANDPNGKAKKKAWRRKKAKGLIEEAYPSYLQDAFFGRPLLDIPTAAGLLLSDEEDTDEGQSYNFLQPRRFVPPTTEKNIHKSDSTLPPTHLLDANLQQQKMGASTPLRVSVGGSASSSTSAPSPKSVGTSSPSLTSPNEKAQAIKLSPNFPPSTPSPRPEPSAKPNEAPPSSDDSKEVETNQDNNDDDDLHLEDIDDIDDDELLKELGLDPDDMKTVDDVAAGADESSGRAAAPVEAPVPSASTPNPASSTTKSASSISATSTGNTAGDLDDVGDVFSGVAELEKNFDIHKMAEEGPFPLDSKTVEDIFSVIGDESSQSGPPFAPSPNQSNPQQQASHTVGMPQLPGNQMGPQAHPQPGAQAHPQSLGPLQIDPQGPITTGPNQFVRGPHGAPPPMSPISHMGPGNGHGSQHPGSLSPFGMPNNQPGLSQSPFHPSPGAVETQFSSASAVGAPHGFSPGFRSEPSPTGIPPPAPSGVVNPPPWASPTGPVPPGMITSTSGGPQSLTASSPSKSGLEEGEVEMTSGDTGKKATQLSYNQRTVQKWEEDEKLGLSATISPVLYANMVHPEFKEKYPDWTERAKQIMKIWRRIPTEDRAPFLAKARENRAQRRMDKSQKQVSEALQRRGGNTAGPTGPPPNVPMSGQSGGPDISGNLGPSIGGDMLGQVGPNMSTMAPPPPQQQQTPSPQANPMMNNPPGQPNICSGSNPSAGGSGPHGMSSSNLGINVMSDNSSPIGGSVQSVGPRPMMGGPQGLIGGPDSMICPPVSGANQTGPNFPMRMMGGPGMNMRMPNPMRIVGGPMPMGPMGGPLGQSTGLGIMPEDTTPIMLPPGMKAGPDAEKFIKDQKLVREKEQEARWKMLQQQRIAQRMAQQQQQQQQIGPHGGSVFDGGPGFVPGVPQQQLQPQQPNLISSASEINATNMGGAPSDSACVMTGVPSPASSVTSQGGTSDAGGAGGLARSGTPGADGRLSQSGTPEPRSGGASPMPPQSPKDKMLLSPTGSSPRHGFQVSSPVDDPEARMASTPPISSATPPPVLQQNACPIPAQMIRPQRPQTQTTFDPYSSQPGTPHPSSQLIMMRPPGLVSGFGAPIRAPAMTSSGDPFVKPPPPPPRPRPQTIVSSSSDPISSGTDPFLRPAPPSMARPNMGPPRFMGPPLRGTTPNAQNFPRPQGTPNSPSPSSPMTDPYLTPPGTPRPGPVTIRMASKPTPDSFSTQPQTPRPSLSSPDPYNQQPITPRPSSAGNGPRSPSHGGGGVPSPSSPFSNGGKQMPLSPSGLKPPTPGHEGSHSPRHQPNSPVESFSQQQPGASVTGGNCMMSPPHSSPGGNMSPRPPSNESFAVPQGPRTQMSPRGLSPAVRGPLHNSLPPQNPLHSPEEPFAMHHHVAPSLRGPRPGLLGLQDPYALQSGAPRPGGKPDPQIQEIRQRYLQERMGISQAANTSENIAGNTVMEMQAGSVSGSMMSPESGQLSPSGSMSPGGPASPRGQQLRDHLAKITHHKIMKHRQNQGNSAPPEAAGDSCLWNMEAGDNSPTVLSSAATSIAGPRGPPLQQQGPRGSMMGLMGPPRPMMVPDGLMNTPPRGMMTSGSSPGQMMNMRMGGPTGGTHFMEEGAMSNNSPGGIMRPVGGDHHMMHPRMQMGNIPGHGQMFMRPSGPLGFSMDMQHPTHPMQMRMGGPTNSNMMQNRGPYPWGMNQTNATSGTVQAVDAGGNPLDPYDHLVRQPHFGPRGSGGFQPGGPGGPRVSMPPSGPSVTGGPLAAMQQQFAGPMATGIMEGSSGLVSSQGGQLMLSQTSAPPPETPQFGGSGGSGSGAGTPSGGEGLDEEGGLDDLLGSMGGDGDFNILAYTDADLGLGGEKDIFDEHLGLKSASSSSAAGSPSASSTTPVSSVAAGTSTGGNLKDFQSKFLEFSKKSSEEATPSKTSDSGGDNAKKLEKNVDKIKGVGGGVVPQLDGVCDEDDDEEMMRLGSAISMLRTDSDSADHSADEEVAAVFVQVKRSSVPEKPVFKQRQIEAPAAVVIKSPALIQVDGMGDEKTPETASSLPKEEGNLAENSSSPLGRQLNIARPVGASGTSQSPRQMGPTAMGIHSNMVARGMTTQMNARGVTTNIQGAVGCPPVGIPGALSGRTAHAGVSTSQMQQVGEVLNDDTLRKVGTEIPFTPETQPLAPSAKSHFQGTLGVSGPQLFAGAGSQAGVRLQLMQQQISGNDAGLLGNENVLHPQGIALQQMQQMQIPMSAASNIMQMQQPQPAQNSNPQSGGLLQDQPLLLEDLVAQEKAEQQQQQQQQGATVGIMGMSGGSEGIMNNSAIGGGSMMAAGIHVGPHGFNPQGVQLRMRMAMGGGPQSFMTGPGPQIGEAMSMRGPPPSYPGMRPRMTINSGMGPGPGPSGEIMSNTMPGGPNLTIGGSVAAGSMVGGPSTGIAGPSQVGMGAGSSLSKLVEGVPSTSPVGSQGPGAPNMAPGSRPPVPAPGDEKGRAEYEQWLLQHENLLTMQVKYLEAQITKQRKTKKALNARQRQVKKMGQELPVPEAQELEKVSQEQALIQRQLDTSRRKLRQHQMTIQEYRMKQGQLNPMMGPIGPRGPNPMMNVQTSMIGPGSIPNIVSSTGMLATSGSDSSLGPRMVGPRLGSPHMAGPQIGGSQLGQRGMLMQMGPGNGMMGQPQQQLGGNNNQIAGISPNMGGSGPATLNRGGCSPIGGMRGASPVSGGAQGQAVDVQQAPSPLMSPNSVAQGTMSPNASGQPGTPMSSLQSPSSSVPSPGTSISNLQRSPTPSQSGASQGQGRPSSVGPSAGQLSPCPSVGQQSAESPTSNSQLSPVPPNGTSASNNNASSLFQPPSSTSTTPLSGAPSILSMAGPPSMGQIGPRPQMSMKTGELLTVHGGLSSGGARTSMRMTAAQKAEYDQYMQNLLMKRGFNPGPSLQISQDDNNPFSDGFQTKLHLEQQEKMRQQMMAVGSGGGPSSDQGASVTGESSATSPTPNTPTSASAISPLSAEANSNSSTSVIPSGSSVNFPQGIMPPSNRMAFNVGSGGPFRFARPPGDMMMGTQGPLMGGPGPRGFPGIEGQRGPPPFALSGNPSGTCGPAGGVEVSSDGAQIANDGNATTPTPAAPSTQEFPMPPNFPGAIEMMAGQTEEKPKKKRKARKKKEKDAISAASDLGPAGDGSPDMGPVNAMLPNPGLRSSLMGAGMVRGMMQTGPRGVHPMGMNARFPVDGNVMGPRLMMMGPRHPSTLGAPENSSPDKNNDTDKKMAPMPTGKPATITALPAPVSGAAGSMPSPAKANMTPPQRLLTALVSDSSDSTPPPNLSQNSRQNQLLKQLLQTGPQQKQQQLNSQQQQSPKIMGATITTSTASTTTTTITTASPTLSTVTSQTGETSKQSIDSEETDDEDFLAANLTPEQRKQLELIDSMPLTRELSSPQTSGGSDTSSEQRTAITTPGGGGPQTIAENALFEQRRQEFELRRKELGVAVNSAGMAASSLTSPSGSDDQTVPGMTGTGIVPPIKGKKKATGGLTKKKKKERELQEACAAAAAQIARTMGEPGGGMGPQGSGMSGPQGGSGIGPQSGALPGPQGTGPSPNGPPFTSAPGSFQPAPGLMQPMSQHLAMSGPSGPSPMMSNPMMSNSLMSHQGGSFMPHQQGPHGPQSPLGPHSPHGPMMGPPVSMMGGPQGATGMMGPPCSAGPGGPMVSSGPIGVATSMGPVGHMGPVGPMGPGGPICSMGPGGPMMSMNPCHTRPSDQSPPPASGPKRKRKNGPKTGTAAASLVAGPPSVGPPPPPPPPPPGPMMMGPVSGVMGAGSTAGPEDYEVFTEGILAQLRSMPQVPLMEPVVKRSFTECPAYGSGPMNGESLLTGVFGAAKPESRPDYYTSFPFGSGDRFKRQSQLLEHLTGLHPGSNVPNGGIPSGDGSGRGAPLPPSSTANISSVAGVVDFPRLGPPSRASSGTPDTIVSSSSPECGVNNQGSESQTSPEVALDAPGPPDAYFCPALRPLDEAKRSKEESERLSPPLVLVTPVPLRARELKTSPTLALTESNAQTTSLSNNEAIDVKSTDNENVLKPLVKEEPKSPAIGFNPLAKLDHSQSKLPLSELKMDNNDNISVTLTLSATASQNVQAVIRAVANLLQVAVPSEYDFQKLDAFGRHFGDKTHHVLVEPLSPEWDEDSEEREEPLSKDVSPGKKSGKTKYCRECDVVVLSAGIQKKVSEMKHITKIDPELKDDDEVTFCSSKCYVQFTIGKSTIAKTEPVDATQTSAPSPNSSALKPLSVQTGIKASPSSSPHASPTAQLSPQVKMEPGAPPRVPPIRIPLGRLGADSASGLSGPGAEAPGANRMAPGVKSPPFSLLRQGYVKKWKGKRWRKWDHGMVNRHKETKKHSDPEVAEVMDSLAIAIRAKTPQVDTPTSSEVEAKTETLEETKLINRSVGLYSDATLTLEDRRCCVLCAMSGDADTDGPGRLLNMDIDKWVHLNCALWSSEVYETLNGALMNVDGAVSRGAKEDCSICSKKGATLGCFRPRCPSILHLPCARAAGALFYQDKTLLCHSHAKAHLNDDGAAAAALAAGVSPSLLGVALGEKDGHLKDLSVFRRVYINRDESKQIASIINQQALEEMMPEETATTTTTASTDDDPTATAGAENSKPKSSSPSSASASTVTADVVTTSTPDKADSSESTRKADTGVSRFNLRIGSMIFQNVGQLLPHQLEAFHTENHVFPVGFQITRYYWSMHALHKRCKYVCSVADKDGAPEFVVNVEEEGHPKKEFRDSTTKGAFLPTLDAIAKMRDESGLVHLFPDYIQGENLFGLSDLAVVRIIESLPGIEHISNYNFRFGRSPHMELPLAINPTGCARSEPKLRTHFQSVRPRTLMTRSMGSRLPSSVSGITGVVDHSPYMKQFIHSKSQQYRKLRTEWRNNVYLGRSRIQGLGLFAGRDLEKNTMVIEYIGDVIRNEVANRREKIYESQNRGIYMFRVNEDLVVDATIAGGPARYINHSCSPNCIAEVVEFEKGGKIIIVSNRRICRGEELTYDYKFDFEDDETKIACLCGSPVCRKWMN